MTFQARFLRHDGTLKTVSGLPSLRRACLLARDLCGEQTLAAQVHRDRDGKMLAQFLAPELEERIAEMLAFDAAIRRN